MHNSITIVGNLGRDPEMGYFPSGDAYTTFNVATNRRWRTRDGEAKEHTEWYRITAFGRLAEITNEYLEKGGLVYVEGTHSTRPWQTDNGQLRAGNEVRAHVVKFLGGGSSGEDTGYEGPPRPTTVKTFPGRLFGFP